ncbi:MAG TPA: sulfite oxidase [Candidatus Eisenbacteria bacterium]|nr:sulfite oxidase [Candidatus Eisenbacteria bacterium]
MAGMDRRTFLRALSRAGLASWTLGAWHGWARGAGPAAQAAKPAAPAAPAAELIERNAWPEHFETTLSALGRSWTTRNDRFFVRSHLPAPTIDPATWRLEVTGLVANPLSLNLKDIQAIPSTEAAVTLECAGNGRGLFKLANTSGTQWERGAVGNATWTGVKLPFLLRRAQVMPEARHVWFEAADVGTLPDVPPFLRSIPIEKAMFDVLLAHTMNGEPLPKLHGGPLRVIVPAWYGMASTKWVTRIRLEKIPSDNHFMAGGYRYNYPGDDPSALAPPVEEMKVKSVITRPLEGGREALGKVRIQGFAWAGAMGVRLVETSIDRGKTWKPAGFMGETAPGAWRAWATEYEIKTPARLSVMARATDGKGEVQPAEARVNSAGYANNSIHVVSFRVA